MRLKFNNFIKWTLVLLFTSYVAAITLFTHNHVIDKVTYVHSHPFHKSDHTHTDGQLVLLHHFFHTALTSSVVPEFDFSDLSNSRTYFFPDFYVSNHLIEAVNNQQLRAPPTAA